MRDMGTRRFLAAAVLALYVLMPQAAFGSSPGSECRCIHDGLRCGQDGFTCHCCIQEGADTVSATMLSKCRTASSEFSITHPPAALGPVSAIQADTSRPAVLSYTESVFCEISIAPPLRPPNPLPAVH